MEKSKVEVFDTILYHEKFLFYLVVAIALLLVEFVFANLILKRIP